jgi:hypothetical protein
MTAEECIDQMLTAVREGRDADAMALWQVVGRECYEDMTPTQREYVSSILETAEMATDDAPVIAACGGDELRQATS